VTGGVAAARQHCAEGEAEGQRLAHDYQIRRSFPSAAGQPATGAAQRLVFVYYEDIARYSPALRLLALISTTRPFAPAADRLKARSEIRSDGET
jgi:hypothetical protein